jgi:hypothetical protein
VQGQLEAMREREETVTRISMTIAAAVALTALTPAAAMAAPAGPQLAKCGKHKQGLGKKSGARKRKALRRFRLCLRQNKANRIAFNQIKNSNFDGERGDGQEVDWTFCANGKADVRTTSRSGTGVSELDRWWIANAVVRNGGRWIDAFVGAPGGFEVGIMRRGARWRVGVTSFDRIIYPGDVVKADARRECATL